MTTTTVPTQPLTPSQAAASEAPLDDRQVKNCERIIAGYTVPELRTMLADDFGFAAPTSWRKRQLAEACARAFSARGKQISAELDHLRTTPTDERYRDRLGHLFSDFRSIPDMAELMDVKAAAKKGSALRTEERTDVNRLRQDLVQLATPFFDSSTCVTNAGQPFSHRTSLAEDYSEAVQLIRMGKALVLVHLSQVSDGSVRTSKDGRVFPVLEAVGWMQVSSVGQAELLLREMYGAYRAVLEEAKADRFSDIFDDLLVEAERPTAEGFDPSEHEAF